MVASDVCDEGFGCLLSSRGSSGSSSGTLLYQNSVERVQAVAHLAATTACGEADMYHVEHVAAFSAGVCSGGRPQWFAVLTAAALLAISVGMSNDIGG